MTTVTHARLRAEQGDATGARRILKRILDEDPGHGEARRMMEEIGSRADRLRVGEAVEPLAPRVAADASGLATRFREALGASRSSRRRRLERLRSWLETIQRNRAGGIDA